MKRSSKFIVGLVAAAMTFGSLVVIQGPKKMDYSPYEHHHHHDCHDGKDADMQVES